ncbi:MAG: methyltransferase domain-containing protein [Phycisphaerales bacterium]|nr:methyltransferase domain-containing protein [Phycisphaerales bacterium]
MSSAGDVDYSVIGLGYSSHRRPDPRIAAMIHAALGDAKSVLNVGAGSGSYEPTDRAVIAVEPADTMRRQRPAHLAPAIDTRAESLPLADQSVDASMAIITVHQWQDMRAGLRELLRVTRGNIVLMTFAPGSASYFWLGDYCPELAAVEARRDPPIETLAAALAPAGRRVEIVPVPVPIDCTDGFSEAYYARPERLLDPNVTRAQSSWAFVDEAVRERFVTTLRADLASGEWDRKYGQYRSMPTFTGALRLIVSRPANSTARLTDQTSA